MFKSILTFIFLTLVVLNVQAEWLTTNVDRVQVLPQGNVTFWLTTNSSGCGSHDSPYRAGINMYAVDINGVKSFTSVLMVAISTSKNVAISVRDEQCYVDSIVLLK